MILFKRRLRSIYDIAESFREKLLAGEERSIKAILKAYSVATKDVEAEIVVLARKIAERKATGQTVEAAWTYESFRYHRLLQMIQHEVTEASTMVQGIVTRHQAENIELGLESVEEMAAINPVIEASFIGTSPGALRAIVGTLTDGSPLSTLFRDMGPGAVTKARAVIPKNVVLGINPRQTARELRKEIVGLEQDRALTISRTEQLRAFRMAQQTSYRQNPHVFTGWRWVSARDARTCPICIGLDGTVHELHEIFGCHPNCRCTTIPVLRFGDVSNGTGEEWFAKQRPDFQEQVLGRARLAVYKQGTSIQEMIHSYDDKRWGPQKRLIPLSKLRK